MLILDNLLWHFRLTPFLWCLIMFIIIIQLIFFFFYYSKLEIKWQIKSIMLYILSLFLAFLVYIFVGSSQTLGQLYLWQKINHNHKLTSEMNSAWWVLQNSIRNDSKDCRAWYWLGKWYEAVDEQYAASWALSRCINLPVKNKIYFRQQEE